MSASQIQIPNNWQPRPYQRPFWDYLEKGGKRAIEIAHRRWGKDDVLLHRTAVAALERPATYWHCLPEYEQARKAIWNAVNPHTGKRRIDEAFPEEIRAGKDEQQMFIRFKNGSTWQVIGSDRYNSLVGAGVAGVVFSEWALANPSSWAYIRPMMEENNGWAAFITTPRGRNHAKAMYDMAKNNPKWFCESSTVYDTGALSLEQIEESKQEYIALYGDDLGEAQFQQEYECSFNAAIMGAFFAREMVNVRGENRIHEIERDFDLPIHTAWDLGVSDTTAIWVFQVAHDGIRVLDFYESSGVGLEHYVEWLEARNYSKGNDYVPHDVMVQEWASGRTRFDVMRSLGRQPRKVPSVSVQDGIQAARKTLPLTRFDLKCEERGIAALEQYRREWDDKTKAFRLKPKHDWASNAADAWRYLSLAWQEMRPEAKEKKFIPNDYVSSDDVEMDIDSWRI